MSNGNVLIEMEDVTHFRYHKRATDEGGNFTGTVVFLFSLMSI